MLSGWIVWRAGRTTPAAICRRLDREDVVRVRTRYGLGAWNPAEPLGPRNRTPDGPGAASYSRTGDGQVRLDLVLASGHRETHIGPPVGAQRRLLRWLPVGVYAASGMAGAAIGRAAGGPSMDGQWHGGALGALVGVLVGYIAVLMGVIAWRGLRAVRDEAAATGGKVAPLPTNVITWLRGDDPPR